jgi:hypothetical protein
MRNNLDAITVILKYLKDSKMAARRRKQKASLL